MNRILIFILGLLVLACKSNKNMVDQSDVPYEVIIEETYLDTLIVSAPKIVEEIDNELPLFRASYKRTNDLIHTALNLFFDWERQYVIGQATLDFKAIRKNKSLELQAKNFDIKEIKLNGKSTPFEYDNQLISIPLDKEYKRAESFQLWIDYVAKPNEGPVGGSDAIMSDKGLFFINPLNEIKGKPRQIWTQGETEHNSKWFPTIDKPNERCTQEMYLTVEKDLETLSNGKLISSTDNGDGTKTDYWKQSLAHAPYLFMIAIGEFSITEDEWNGIPLMYYVDTAYAAHAEKIYNHTPEMLSFFSDLLEYPYPWEKYAQVAVSDYVSGAMENTTAVIYGDFVLKTERELIDNHNDQIVAHELFHHWFGDLVTCESWSNLTMNEGFANYAEYLWYEYKYGKDEAEWHRINELSSYIQSAYSMGMHDLIDYQYADKEDMFDAHSYNKGGLVLHMLRNYLGDELFFEGLHEFLQEHQYTAVEAHDLRLTMEEVSGEDLIWFFDQWYFSSGHPELEINYSSDEEEKSLEISCMQTQEGDGVPSIFQLPVDIKIYFEDGSIVTKAVMLNQRKQNFEFGPFDQVIGAVVFDGNHIIPGQINETAWKDFDQVLLQYSKEFQDRYFATKRLSKAGISEASIKQILNQGHYTIRRYALSSIEDPKLLAQLALNDPHSEIRAEALASLADKDIDEAVRISYKLIKTEQAYPPIIEAIDILAVQNEESAIRELLSLSKDYVKPFYPIYFELLASTQNPKYISRFEEELFQVDLMNLFDYFQSYRELAQYGSVDQNVKAAELFSQVAMDSANLSFKRYIAAYSIKQLKLNLQGQKDKIEGKESQMKVFDKLLHKIIKKENDPSMRARFESLV